MVLVNPKIYNVCIFYGGQELHWLFWGRIPLRKQHRQGKVIDLETHGIM